MWEAEEAEERNIIHNLPANFSVHAKRQAGGSGSTAAWREVQKPGTQSALSKPVLLSGKGIRVAQGLTVHAGSAESNGHECHNLLPWTGLREGLLLSPKWVPSPGTNDTGICRKISGRSNDKFLIRRWGKMQRNQNADSMRNTEKRHKKRQRTQILIQGGRTWRKRLTEEAQSKQREALRKERTHASYEREKPREDEKAGGFNYREHIKMK